VPEADVRERTFDLKALLPGDYYCTGCAERVCDALGAVAGVQQVSCDLAEGAISVSFEPQVLAPRELEAALSRLALEATDRVGHAAFRITGLD
jgi:copper chaperone CopZ